MWYNHRNALVSSALFCGLFFRHILHKIRAWKNTKFIMVRLSRRIPLAVSLSLNFCLFETSERISFARESREKEENARSRINLLFLSFSLRVDLRSALRAFTLALVRETVVRAKMMTRVCDANGFFAKVERERNARIWMKRVMFLHADEEETLFVRRCCCCCTARADETAFFL